MSTPMAGQISLLYQGWNARCLALKAQAESLRGSGASDESAIEDLTSQVRQLLNSSREIDDRISPGDLRGIARNGLMVVQQLEAILKRLPQSHPIWAIFEELRDEVEVLAESSDPETIRLIEKARQDASRNELVPLEHLD